MFLAITPGYKSTAIFQRLKNELNLSLTFPRDTLITVISPFTLVDVSVPVSEAILLFCSLCLLF